MNLPALLITYQTRINQVLESCLPTTDTEPALLHQAMRYSALSGGKRLRAMLVYATAEVFTADQAIAEQAIAEQAAAAVELVHAYSLIHDDLPAMDDDDLRHGRPSCHRAYGDAVAILAGDALQSLAFELLAAPNPEVNAAQQLKMLAILARAIGSQGMVGGQVLDITEEALANSADNSALDTIHQKKTGALIVASVSLGALAGNCQNTAQLQALETFASKLGLAFQIHDDILDMEDSSVSHALNYPAIFGLQTAKQRVQQLYRESLQCLETAAIKSATLQALAEFVVNRDF